MWNWRPAGRRQGDPDEIHPLPTAIEYSLRLFLALLLFLLVMPGAGRTAPRSATDSDIPLTASERDWLETHRQLVIAPSPDFPPVEFFDKSGRYSGIAADYLRILERKLGVRFKIKRLANWQEIVAATKRGDVDVWGAATPSPERSTYMSFTRPYLSFPAAIIVRKGTFRDLTMDSLRGLKVVSLSGHVTDEYLNRNYPSLDKIMAPDVQTGLKMVSFGVAEVIVVNEATASFYISELGLTNLAIAGQSHVTWPLSFASRREYPELNSILQKALDSIPAGQRNAMVNSRVSLDRGGFVSRRAFWLTLLAAVGSTGIVIAIVLVMNRSLSGMVRQRTADLQRELDGRRQAESELEARTESLEAILTIADRLYRSLDLKAVAEQAVSAMMHRSNSPSVAIFLLDREGEHLDMLHSLGFTEGLVRKAHRLPATGSLTGVAVQRHCVAVCQDVANDTRLEPAVKRALSDDGYCAAVSVPLLAEERVLGALNLLYRERPFFSSLAERELLVIGHTVGLAISHAINVAHLREEMAVRRETEEALRILNTELERRVTERTSELSEAKERAESADRLKSAFLATMSHELRTPLNSIIGFAGILRQGLAGPLNEEQKKQLDMVRNSANHLLELINDVLDLSKIEAGRLTLARQRFDLGASLEKAIRSVRPLAEAKGLDLELEIAGDVAAIDSDQRRVEQIVLNLLGNAVKFTEKGNISVKCCLSEHKAWISVSDTGIGIREEDLDNLFKPFRQLETGLTRRYEGTGLGLSICRKLVECLGGEIRVASRAGKGSTFTFTLPLTGETS